MKINFPAVLDQTVPVESLPLGQCFMKPDDRTEVFMVAGRIYGPPSYNSPVHPRKIMSFNLGTTARVGLNPDTLVLPVEVELTVVKIGRST